MVPGLRELRLKFVAQSQIQGQRWPHLPVVLEKEPELRCAQLEQKFVLDRNSQHDRPRGLECVEDIRSSLQEELKVQEFIASVAGVVLVNTADVEALNLRPELDRMRRKGQRHRVLEREHIVRFELGVVPVSQRGEAGARVQQAHHFRRIILPKTKVYPVEVLEVNPDYRNIRRYFRAGESKAGLVQRRGGQNAGVAQRDYVLPALERFGLIRVQHRVDLARTGVGAVRAGQKARPRARELMVDLHRAVVVIDWEVLWSGNLSRPKASFAPRLSSTIP